MPSRLSPLLLGLSAAASLGACASMPDSGPPPEVNVGRHHIEVAQTGERLEIETASGTLTTKARSDIAGFASAYLRLGHGALILSTPTGGADSAADVAREARLALLESGVTSGAAWTARITMLAMVPLSLYAGKKMLRLAGWPRRCPDMERTTTLPRTAVDGN